MKDVEDYKLFSGQFPGTIITIKFKTDDTHHYSLRNEEKINLDNIFYETKRKHLDDIVLSILEIDKDINIEKVESQLLNTQQSIFLLKLMDDALSRLSAYPNKGEIYADIITYKYFEKKIRSNEEISELLLISRSTYYRYMNKAILIFGVMLFGYSVFDRNYEDLSNCKLKVAEDRIDYKIEL